MKPAVQALLDIASAIDEEWKEENDDKPHPVSEALWKIGAMITIDVQEMLNDLFGDDAELPPNVTPITRGRPS